MLLLRLPCPLPVSSSCSFALRCSPWGTAFPFGKCSDASCSEKCIRAGAVPLSLLVVRRGGVGCGGELVPSPAGTHKANHLVSHEEAAPAWAGNKLQTCPRLFPRLPSHNLWLALLPPTCCSLNGNTKARWLQKMSPFIYFNCFLIILFFGSEIPFFFFPSCRAGCRRLQKQSLQGPLACLPGLPNRDASPV